MLSIDLYQWTVEAPASHEERGEWPTRELAETHAKNAAAEWGAAVLTGPRGFREVYLADGLAQRARSHALELMDRGLSAGDALHTLTAGVDYLEGLGALELAHALRLGCPATSTVP